MKKALLLIAIFLGSLYSFSASAASSTVVFFIPHQDDEMYMLGAMHRALAEGSAVYAVLATDGGSSNIRKKLEIELKTKISRQQFVEWRNKEFYRSLRSIGIAPNNIVFANPGSLKGSKAPQYLDGKLSYEDAYAIIQKFYDVHGDGTYVTVLADGGHGDHRMLREALVNFIGVSKKRYYSEVIEKGTKEKLTKAEQLAKEKAMAIYYLWKPKSNHYAIASHSVNKLLSFWRYHGYEYFSER